MLLSEITIINPRLSVNQQSVLCIAYSSPTSTVALEQTNKTPNTVEARKTLINMGMLETDDDGGIIVTDDGVSAMEREDLIDSTGTLTDRGQKLIAN